MTVENGDENIFLWFASRNERSPLCVRIVPRAVGVETSKTFADRLGIFDKLLFRKRIDERNINFVSRRFPNLLFSSDVLLLRE